MAAQRFPSLEHLPITAPKDQVLTPEPLEPEPEEITNFSLLSTTLEDELSTRWDDSFYVQHWGINE